VFLRSALSKADVAGIFDRESNRCSLAKHGLHKKRKREKEKKRKREKEKKRKREKEEERETEKYTGRKVESEERSRDKQRTSVDDLRPKVRHL
jgi:hypothetical protein